ncbi:MULTISPECIES: glutaredoxin domain-containing protein [Coprobacillaceae]|uniref:glutaredoxin domain-containing protein n=1 Tax=Coprobacillaceae TaxID=2810280 RepID=UPI000E4B18F8|nr:MULTISPECIES: glutaredoxin domain-containing protein [Coprobacillaceae]RHM59947.1 glutaredoxin [Coprobacillus sp. AF33-1AC]RHS92284.1 glutaredoxin [Erysipelatoclostridium sp. AM42-17]
MKLFILPDCPYCKQAIKWIKELKEDVKYQNIDIQLIDESQEVELADSYDYYYVPALFDGTSKYIEGATTYQELKSVFDKHLKNQG